jgi:protein tyrosine/serine phosphatase
MKMPRIVRRRHELALVLLVSLLAASGYGAGQAARPEKWATPVPSATLKNWYQLDADVYRSEQPTRRGFEEIRDRGIKSIVNLRDSHSDAKLVEGLGLGLAEIPMSASSFSADDVVKALRAIRAAPKPVLFHCQHGSDRTGLIAAMYRIVFQGWPKDEALAELKGGGFGFHWYYMNIPAYIRRVDVAKIRELVGFEAAPRLDK